MKIRHTLLALTGFLGLALLAAVALQIRTAAIEHEGAERHFASNGIREQLLRAASALGEERNVTYALLLLNPGGRGESAAALQTLRERVDGYLGRADRAMRREAPLPGNQDRAQALQPVRELLQRVRREADAALENAQEGRRYAPRWFEGVTEAVSATASVRIALLQQDAPEDPLIRAESLLRYYLSHAGEGVSRN